jgi:Chaperone of endosialidase
MALTQVNPAMLVGSSNTTTTIQSNGVTAVTVDASQNVGIGTSSPSTKLYVSGTSTLNGDVVSAGGTSAGLSLYGGTAYNNGAGIALKGSSNTTTPDTIIFTRGAFVESARIDSSGNLLVGTTSPLKAGTSSFVNGGGGSGTLSLKNTGSARYWYIGPNSNGDYVNFNDAGTGMYMNYGATSWTGTSDERVKENLVPITDAVNKVNTLRAVTGNYISDKEKTSRSFLIAQDVQAVLPEAVSAQNDEIGTLGLSYTDVIPLLVAAIKELNAKVDAQAEEIKALKGQLAK